MRPGSIVSSRTVWHLVVLAVLFGLVIWTVSSGIDLLWVMYPGLSVIAVSTVDAVLSIAFGFLGLKLMLAYRAGSAKSSSNLESLRK